MGTEWLGKRFHWSDIIVFKNGCREHLRYRDISKVFVGSKYCKIYTNACLRPMIRLSTVDTQNYAFRITGPSWGEFARGHWWVSNNKRFAKWNLNVSLSFVKTSCRTYCGVADDFLRINAHMTSLQWYSHVMITLSVYWDICLTPISGGTWLCYGVTYPNVPNPFGQLTCRCPGTKSDVHIGIACLSGTSWVPHHHWGPKIVMVTNNIGVTAPMTKLALWQLSGYSDFGYRQTSNIHKRLVRRQ